MNRSLCMFVTVSALTFLMFLVEQSYAKEVRSPCVLTVSEKALVNELTRFRKSSYFSQGNIKKCVIFDVATILVNYENGHIGLFGSGEIIYSDRRQEQQNESRDTKMPNKLQYVSDQYTQDEDVAKFYNEFVNVWHSASLPDELSQESLAYADALAQKLLCTIPLDDRFMVSALGARGNRYLAFIEGCKVLSQEMIFVFYEGYFDVSFTRMRTENIPTDHDKQVIIKQVINILETRKSFQGVFPSIQMSRQIRKFDPNAYGQLVEWNLIPEIDE